MFTFFRYFHRFSRPNSFVPCLGYTLPLSSLHIRAASSSLTAAPLGRFLSPNWTHPFVRPSVHPSVHPSIHPRPARMNVAPRTGPCLLPGCPSSSSLPTLPSPFGVNQTRYHPVPGPHSAESKRIQHTAKLHS